MSQNIVTINGIIYDATTGMRIGEAAVRKPQTTRRPAATAAHTIHSHTQRSATLHRSVAAKHTTVRPDISAKKPSHSPVKPTQSITATRPATTHPLVSKFGQPTSQQPAVKKLDATTKLITPKTVDIAPQAHPMTDKAAARKTTAAPVRATSANLSARNIKSRALSDSLKKAPEHNTKHATKQHKTPKKSRFSRALSLSTASLALLILAGYFTYVNMPNISVRVAASQAGINATYPNYRPDGYNLSGPIAYNNGQVSMKFASTGGSQSYTITQSRSNWDSSAVQQNYAEAKWGNDVITVQANGLTIYKNGSNAVWVNGGILYTISGDAPLSNEQTTTLATSM